MNIQAKIKSKGFTVAEVAKLMKNNRGGIGISQGSLSTALNGNPTIDKLKEVADIIGMSLPELVAEDGETYEPQGFTAMLYNGRAFHVSNSIDDAIAVLQSWKASN